MKNVHESTQERNFFSNVQNISGKNFRFDFSVLQLTVTCYDIYVFFFIIITVIMTIITLYKAARLNRNFMEKEEGRGKVKEGALYPSRYT
jgi:hypothetical protein